MTDRKHAEAESRLLASIVESATVAIVSTDREGVITSWNAGAEALYGWTADEAVGRQIDLVIEDQAGVQERTLRRRALIAGNTIGAAESRRRTRDGRLIEVSLNVSPIRDEAGNVVGISSMAYDITERKRAERDAAAQHAVASVLADSRTVSEAVPRLLEALGSVLGFDAAAGTLFEEGASVHRFDWTRRGTERLPEPPPPAAQIMVTDGDEHLGSLEFFTRRPAAIDVQLEETLDALGSQIGQFVRRRQVEEDLRVTSQRFQAILDNTPALVYVKDRDFRYLIANREFESVYGLEQGIGAGMRDEDFLPPDVVEIVREGDRECLEHGTVLQRETAVPTVRGMRTFVSVKFPLRDASGTPYAVGGVATDITDSRRAIEERTRSEERLADAQRVARVGSWDWDLGADSFTWSSELYRIYGHEPGAFTPDLARALELVHPHDRDMVRDQLDRALAGAPVRYVHRGCRADGEIRWIEAHGEAIMGDDGRPVAMRGTAQDVTERRQAELDLAASRASLAEAQQLAQIGSFVEDRLAGTFTWSDELYRIFGLPMGSPPPRRENLAELFHPDDRQSVRELLFEKQPDGEPIERDFRIIRPNGEQRWLSCRLRVEHDDAGRTVRMSGVAQDVTERLQAEQRLRESEESYRRIVETANEGVWIVDAAGNTTFANARMAEMLGTTAEAMRGRNLLDYTAPAFRDQAAARIQPGNQVVQDVLDVKLLRSDGSEFWAMISSSALIDAAGEYIGALAMVADVDTRVHAQEENERLQARLHESQKLESVGQLAGGIAHDFNNLLAVILNYAEFAAEDVADPKQLGEDITAISEAARRATELTRQLLIFSRREPIATTVVDLNEVVLQTRRLLHRTLGEHIELVTETAGAAPSVNADGGQVEQVLMNLVVNARDAIGDSGTITIRTAVEQIGGDTALDLAPGDYARVTVSDDGRGMSKEVASRALEPFYSTKPRGSGTGLGLATVYGIVKQAGGAIKLSSEVDVGTTVAVYLPVATREPSAEPEPQNAGPPEGSGERVMVVEDEDNVREVTCRTLARHGYHVIPASGPGEARELWEEHAGAIDLVLTDVVMPGASGRTLVHELRRERPDLRCIYMSGYADDVLLRHGAGEGDVALLEKPFSRDVLLRAVHAAITAS